MRMFMTYVVLSFVFMRTVRSDADLQQQNQNAPLDPVNDSEQGHPTKVQDKRTVFSNHHGWAKHVGVHPAGFKYVLGYGPVHLKYVPVVKPISIRAHPHHHHHHHHRFHVKHPLVLRPLLPVRPAIHHDAWKIIVPIVRPAPIVKPVVPIVNPVPVAVNVPAPPHVPHKPWQEPWISPKPVHLHPVKPIVQFVPSKPLIPVTPLVPIPPPLKPLHPVAPPTYPISLIPTAPAGIPLHNPAVFGQYAPGAFVHHQHVVPAPPPPVVVPQLVPQPVFPPHLHPAYVPHVHPQVPHVHPEVHVHPQVPHVHAQVPHVHAQVPHVHAQVPHVHAQVPHVHPEVHLHPQVPHVHLPEPHEQHDVQTPLIPQNHPIFQQQLPHHLFHQAPHDQHPEFFHQELPHEHQHIPAEAPEVFHQQLPHDPNAVFHQPQVPVGHHFPENAPTLFNQQLPGNVQHLFNQQIQHGDGATSNILLHGSIQPGHTDLQFPIHLPQHPNYSPQEGREFQPGNYHDPSQHPDIVRPNIALEPPFTRKK